MNITLKIRGASLALALLIIMNVRVRASANTIPGGFKKDERVKLVLPEGLIAEVGGPIEVPLGTEGKVVGPDPDEIKYLLVLFDNQKAGELAWGVAPEDIARIENTREMQEGLVTILNEYEGIEIDVKSTESLNSLKELPANRRKFRVKKLLREIQALDEQLSELPQLEKALKKQLSELPIVEEQYKEDKKKKQGELDFLQQLELKELTGDAEPAADLDLAVATGLPKLPTARRMNSLQAFQSNVPTPQEITVKAALAKTKPALLPGNTPDFPDDETPHDSLKKALDARPALADAETLRLPADHHPAQAVAADFGAAEVLNALKPETREVRFGRE